MDMRATVGHLTRKIKVHGNNTDWGLHMLVYHWRIFDGAELVLDTRGNFYLDGVEMYNLGQRDTFAAGIDIRYEGMYDVLNKLPTNILKNSALYHCSGMCFNSMDSVKITVD